MGLLKYRQFSYDIYATQKNQTVYFIQAHLPETVRLTLKNRSLPLVDEAWVIYNTIHRINCLFWTFAVKLQWPC